MEWNGMEVHLDLTYKIIILLNLNNLNSFQGGCCFEQSYCNNHCDYIYNIIKPFFLLLSITVIADTLIFFNIILPVNGLLGGTKLQLQGCYTSIWGGLPRLQSVLYLQLLWWSLTTTYCNYHFY